MGRLVLEKGFYDFIVVYKVFDSEFKFVIVGKVDY